MKIIFISLILIIYMHQIFCDKKSLTRLNRMSILKVESKKENVALIYINPRNFSHNLFLQEAADYFASNPLEKYTYGYLEIEEDKKMLEFFKIKKLKESGIILYKFGKKEFYVGEGINTLKELDNIFEQIRNNKLNWSSNSIIEKLFFVVTGKRLGKEAHNYFSFALCIIATLIYISVNMWSKRQDRIMLEKRFKVN